MQQQRLQAVGLSLATVFWVLLAASSPAAEQLVPANFNPRTDGEGFNWDIDQRGMVNDGTNDCFDGGMLLLVNSNNFNAQQSMMTPDGRELVLSGMLSGLGGMRSSLRVTRRMRINDQGGGLRCVEMLENSSRSPVTVVVTIYSDLGGTPQTVVSDSGNPAPTVLDKKDGGIVAVQSPGGRPSVVFHMSSPNSRVKPTWTQSNSEFRFNYNLTIPAGRTVSLIHTCAQKRLAGIPDAATLASIVKPFRARDWIRDLPPEVRRTLINWRRYSYFGGDAPELLAHLERLGVERHKTDMLAMGEETRLQGTAACGSLSLASAFGKVDVPLEKIAAVTGPKYPGGSRVYFRDGQFLRGELAATDLRFTMTSGLTMALDAARLDRLVTRAEKTDGQPGREVFALVETFEGDRLAITRGSPVTLSAVTPWGRREIRLEDLQWLRPPEDNLPGHIVRLKDGSRFYAYLTGSTLNLETQLLGPRQFAADEIRSLMMVRKTAPGATRDAADEGISEPHILVAGGNALVARLDVPAVHIVSQGLVVPVPPEQIRSLRNLGESYDALARGPEFLAEVWGGGTVRGQLREQVLRVRFGEDVWHLPVEDIGEVLVPSPTISDELRTKIARLISELANPEWKQRETASQQLGELGYLAKQQLEDALKRTSDPEATRRIRKLLDVIE